MSSISMILSIDPLTRGVTQAPRGTRANRQQTQWTQKSTHQLLQVRTRFLSNDLAETFKGWFPA